MSRAERLLDLIEEFRRHRYPVSGETLAQTLNVSIRTLYRDIASLRAMGATIEGEPGIGYVLRSGFLLPSVMFTPEEVDALIVGTQWVASKADKPLADAARKAMARLTAIMPSDLVDRANSQELSVWPDIGDKQETIDMTLIRRAIFRETKLHIHYQDKDNTPSQRTIWPFLLGYFDGLRIVAAWCEEKADFRHFRTDRISAVSDLAKRYPRRRHDLVKQWRVSDPKQRN
jgi:predicted DNA-binding transcriptional regulator YafY